MDFTWNAGSGDLNDAANWSQPDPQNLTTPGSQDDVTFTGSGFVNGIGFYNSITVSNADLTFSGQITASRLDMGGPAGADGRFTVDGSGSDIEIDGAAHIGDAGHGTLTIQNGASAYVGGSLVIAGQAGGSGDLVVTGDGATLNATQANTVVVVGMVGAGTLSVTNFATANTTMLLAGYQGSGDVWINGGGAVFTHGVSIANQAGSHGDVSVGMNSTLADTGWLGVGDGGAGTLHVIAGAFASASGVTIGDQAGATGTAVVNGGTLSTNGSIDVGFAGQGELDVATGGAVITSALTVGNQTGSTGAVTVDGPTSHLQVANYLQVGMNGAGTLAVQNGAALDAPSLGVSWQGDGAVTIASGGVINTGPVNLAGQTGTNAQLTVDGAGSALNDTDWMEVGAAGHGVLSVQNGGAATTTLLTIGGNAGAVGAVTVDSGAVLTANGVNLGYQGEGALTIENGGGVTVQSMNLGNQAGSSGVLDIDGAGSVLTDKGLLLVGGGGTGLFEVGDGGTAVVEGPLFISAGGELRLAGGAVQASSMTNQHLIDGYGAIQGTVDNVGVIRATGGTLILGGGMIGPGSAIVDANATLEIGGASNQVVAFNGASAMLKLDDAAHFIGTLTGMTAGDQLDLAGVTVNGAPSLSGSSLSLQTSSGALSFHLQGLSADSAFTAVSDGAGGALLTLTNSPRPSMPTDVGLWIYSDSGVKGDGITNTAEAVITGHAPAGAYITLEDGDGSVVGNAVTDASGVFYVTTSPLSDGAHSFTAIASLGGRDSLPSGPVTVTIDTTAPDAPAGLALDPATDTGVKGDGITGLNQVDIEGHAEAGALITFYDANGGGLETTRADASGGFEITTTLLTDGVHSYTATATDAAGNVSQLSAPLTFTVDTTPPDAPTGLADAAIHNGYVNAAAQASSRLTGSAEAGATVTISDGATVLGTATADANGAWAFDLSKLADGSHSLSAIATDAAGNTGPASAALAFVVDTQPPTPAIDAVATTPNGALITGVSDPSTVVSVYDGGKLVGSATAGADGGWSLSVNAGGDAVHQFTAQTTDLAGNTGATSGVTLYTPAAHKMLVGGAGDDVLVGFNKDTLTGGAGDDRFILGASFGKVTITDFTPSTVGSAGQVSPGDVIQVSRADFADFSSLLAHARQVGANVVISDGAGDALTLNNVSLSSLHSADFLFA